MEDISRDKTLKTLNYLKTGDASEFKDEVKQEEPTRTQKAITAIKEKGFAGFKTAKEQLDDYLGEKVTEAGEKGETAGKAAAVGATAVSTAADMLLPESAGEAAMAALPVGRLGKLVKPISKELKLLSESEIFSKLKKLNAELPYHKQKNADELLEEAALIFKEQKAPAKLDYTGKAHAPTHTETWATKGGNNFKNSMKQVSAVDKVDGEEFLSVLNKAAEKRPLIKEATTPYKNADEIKDFQKYLSPDRKSGFMIKPDGEITGVFSLDKGKGDELVQEAIKRGGYKLDAFDGYLPKFYEKHGFKEYKREKNWTPGGPDVVYMRLQNAKAN